MTAFLQCFWIFPQIGFASNRNLTSSFDKVYDPFYRDFSWAYFSDFSKFSKFGTWFPDFSYSSPTKSPKNRFWGLGTFWHAQKITNLFTILKIFYDFGVIRDISWAFTCYLQYGISPFSKTILKKSKYLREGTWLICLGSESNRQCNRQ